MSLLSDIRARKKENTKISLVDNIQILIPVEIVVSQDGIIR